MATSINSGSIKLLRAEVSLDTPDGGGAQTANEVIDGVSNNMFPDTSQLDRTYGRISMRKVFPSVLTLTKDSYYGSHVIVSKRPADPLVSACLFTTRNWFDRRTSAQNRVEQYLAKGPKWPGHVLETQIEGQRAIQLAVRPADDEPKIGQGLALVSSEGMSTEEEQYVRVTRVTSVLRTFTVNNQDVIRKVLTVEISDPLRYTFIGPTVAAYEVSGTSETHTVCRDTRVANAATYFSARPLAVAGALNDAHVTVDTVYTQLVPASQAETPMVDLFGSGTTTAVTPGNVDPVTTSIGLVTIDNNARVYLGSPITPGTMSLTVGGNVFTEAGGVVKLNGDDVGGIEYDKGLLTFNATGVPATSGSATLEFKPAAAPSRSQHSTGVRVDQSNRGFNYTLTLLPLPAPGSIQVSYMAQGKVYLLYDNSAGALAGVDSSAGAGSINYATGSALVTLSSLPDADTDIVVTWGIATTSFIRSGAAIAPAKLVFEAGRVINPTYLTVSWVANSVTKSVSDNGAGVLTGDGTGTVDYATGRIVLSPTTLTSPSTSFAVDTTGGPLNSQTFSGLTPDGSGNVSITLPNIGGSIIHGSVVLAWQVKLSPAQLAIVQAYQAAAQGSAYTSWTRPYDAGAVDHFTSGSSGTMRKFGSTANTGTIDYTTRAVTANTNFIISVPKPVFGPVPRGAASIIAGN